MAHIAIHIAIPTPTPAVQRDPMAITLPLIVIHTQIVVPLMIQMAHIQIPIAIHIPVPVVRTAMAATITTILT